MSWTLFVFNINKITDSTNATLQWNCFIRVPNNCKWWSKAGINWPTTNSKIFMQQTSTKHHVVGSQTFHSAQLFQNQSTYYLTHAAYRHYQICSIHSSIYFLNIYWAPLSSIQGPGEVKRHITIFTFKELDHSIKIIVVPSEAGTKVL